VNDDPDGWMKLAVDLAYASLNSGVGRPFGAVIVRDGAVVGQAGNEVLARCDPTAHAEMLAIRRAAKTLKSRDLSACDIYVSGMPCPMCYSAIYWSRLRTVFYGASSGDLGEIVGFNDAELEGNLSRPVHERKDPEIRQILAGRDAARACYRAWGPHAHPRYTP
jgi:guanine deaminase